MLEKLGIYEKFITGGSAIHLFDNDEDREKVWNTYTEYGRKERQFKKCKVKIEYQIKGLLQGSNNEPFKI